MENTVAVPVISPNMVFMYVSQPVPNQLMKSCALMRKIATSSQASSPLITIFNYTFPVNW